MGIYPRRETVVLGNIGAAGRLLILLEDPAMRSTLSSTTHHLAENRLLTGWHNVISRAAHAEELPQIKVRATLEVRVETQRRVRPHKQQGIANRIANVDIPVCCQ